MNVYAETFETLLMELTESLQECNFGPCVVKGSVWEKIGS